MKVHYDDEVDALYLKLGDQKPDGAVEIAEGINIDTTTDGCHRRSETAFFVAV